jgi:hypothetical protein
MAKPLNEKLWTMVVFQAKNKYHPYPSPGASHWVHQKYVELGGKFEDSNDHTARVKEMTEAWKQKLKDKKEKADSHEGKKHKGK